MTAHDDTPEGASNVADAPAGTSTPPRPDVDGEVAPIEQLSRAVRADVGRLKQVWRTVRTPFEMVGIGLVVASGLVGVITTLVVGFHDWYMHLGMHLVMLALALLYLRAHLRARRFRRAGYAIVTVIMYAFFAWALVDLAPPRLEIVGDLTTPDGGIIPDVAMRPEASPLLISAGLLGLAALWVTAHWVIYPRKGAEG